MTRLLHVIDRIEVSLDDPTLVANAGRGADWELSDAPNVVIAVAKHECSEFA